MRMVIVDEETERRGTSGYEDQRRAYESLRERVLSEEPFYVYDPAAPHHFRLVKTVTLQS